MLHARIRRGGQPPRDGRVAERIGTELDGLHPSTAVHERLRFVPEMLDLHAMAQVAWRPTQMKEERKQPLVARSGWDVPRVRIVEAITVKA